MKKFYVDEKNIIKNAPEYATLILSLIEENNKFVIPSFVDVHTHLREPGFFNKETVKTGSLAGAKSGYSHIFSMPNLKPVPDNMEHLTEQLNIIKKDAKINVIPYGSITVNEKGKELSDLEDMADFVVAFSDDGVGLNDEKLLLEAMERVKKLDKILVCHCEDLTLRGRGYIHDGEYAKLHNHIGISSESEYLPIKRDLELVKKVGCKYHVCHISTKESVELIRKAKSEGIDVTCETAPHYLIFNDMDLEEDGRFKMNPPIRSEEDRQALLEGIKDGTIDMIATDHAPHTMEEKSKGLKHSLMGVTGLECAFPILYTYLVKKDIITMERLIELMSINPRKRFGLPRAEENGDFAVINVGEEYEINPEDFISMGKSTPFKGFKVEGEVILNIVGGKEVYKKI